MLRHGFETLRLESISARSLAGNTSSRRVMAECGFEFAGEFVHEQDVLAGRGEGERAAVKYLVTRQVWLAVTRLPQMAKAGIDLGSVVDSGGVSL